MIVMKENKKLTEMYTKQIQLIAVFNAITPGARQKESGLSSKSSIKLMFNVNLKCSIKILHLPSQQTIVLMA